ncbi:phage tail tape measure protein [Hymenobacter defluvii]|uniref:Phage tail tape measure protein n=1 Tax=Hymenobacter defluvii TaxID=2054411 RepID=A0ABS3TAQ9_9BACT|nr:phage tail tape measure protein [Hymenobacter defluvii]MBO3270742.1 phage tail tape measure protein [Hymenobacter defluvii]
MAVDKEKRELEIILNAQQANASIKEMGAGVALMKNQLEKMAADDPRRAQLQKDFQELSKRVGEARAENRTYQKSVEELAEEERKLNEQNQQVILNGKKVSASFNEMDQAAKLLEAQLKDLSADDPGRKKMVQDYQDLQQRIGLVKTELGETAEKGFTMKDALMFAGVDLGLSAAVDIVKEFGAEIAQTVKEFGELRSNVNGLTGATGEELDQLTTGVAGLAKSFNKEYDEILVASNALSKQMGISQKEALDLIEKGFVSGADVNGEFLDQLKEYPAQFKAAGLSASEFVAVISKSQTDGVFSDKGADLVKEFGLRIREQTSATKDAMFAAFGPEFTETLLDGVNKGTISTTEALQRISKEMDTTKLTAAQAQTVIADVFGGPGEDAGLDYIKSLQNVGTGIDELIDKTNPYIQRQQALIDSNKELAGVQNDLAKEFEGGSSIMDRLSNQAMTVLYSMVLSLVAVFKEIFSPLQDVWNAFLELGESLGIFSKEGITARDIGEAIGAVFRALLTPTRFLISALAEGAKWFIDWAKNSEVARVAILALTFPIRAFFELLTNGPAYFAGFTAAAETAFTRIGSAIKMALRGDFDGAKAEFGKLGGDAAASFQKAFSDAMSKKSPDAPTAAPAAPGEEPTLRAAGGDGTTQKERDDAAKAAEAAAKKRQQERDKADKDRLDATKRWVAEEGELLKGRDALLDQLDRQSMTDQEARRQAQRDKLFADADARVAKLTGTELDYTEQVKGIVEARNLALRELADKFEEEDEKKRQDALAEQLAMNAAEEEVKMAEEEVKLANGVLNEQTFQDAIYAVKKAAAERELALLQEKGGVESAEYAKASAAKLKEEAAYITKKKALDNELVKFEMLVGAAKKLLTTEEVAFLGEAFGKKSGIYKAAIAAQKAVAIAEIGIGLSKQFAANAEAGAKISALFPPASIGLGTAYTIGANVASTVSAGVATAKVLGFRTGGATGAAGMGKEVGLQVGSNGKLVDSDGFAVAGVVHENEYVIPAWLRQDPQVIQMEQYLEARRMRGYLGGGATSGDVVPAAPGAVVGGESQLVQLLTELVTVQRQQNDRMDTWARDLKVIQSLYEFDQEYGTYKKVNNESGIR